MADEKPQNTTDLEKKEQTSPKKLPLSETLLLAVASAGVYLFAFLYERGFLSYFGIPTQFVTVSLVTLLIFGAATVSLLISAVGLANLVFIFLPKHKFLEIILPRMLLIGFLTVIVPLVLYRGGRQWLIALSIWIVCTIGLAVFPLIKYSKSGNWEARYDAAIEAASEGYTPDLYVHVERRYGVRDLGFIVFLLIACTGLAGTMGTAEATTQEQFLVLNTVPEMVVLRVSGETMICAPFDRNTHEVKKSFSILKIAEDPKLIMNLESVGPLKPVEKLSSETIVPTPTPTPENTPSPTPTLAPTPSTEPTFNKP